MSDESTVEAKAQNDESIAAHLADAQAVFGEEVKHETKKQTTKESSEETKPKENAADELLKSAGINPVKEEAKEEVKAEEKKPDDDSDLTPPPEDSDNRAHWNTLKERKNEALARVAELEKQLAERPAGDDAVAESLKARVKELETQNEQYSSRLKELDFKSHPEYFNQYEKPIQEAQDALKQIAAQEDVDINVEALSALKGKEFAEAVSDTLEQLSRFNGDRFSNAAQQLLAKISERDAVSENAEEFIQRSNEEFQAQTRAVFDQVSGAYSQILTPMEIPVDADDATKADIEAYNTQLANVSKVAEQLAFGNIGQQEVAQMANEAAQYRFLMSQGLQRMATNAAARIDALESELNAIKAAGPTYQPRTTQSKSTTMAELDHIEAARAAFR